MMVAWMIVCRYDFRDQMELSAFACDIRFVKIKHTFMKTKKHHLIMNFLISWTKSVSDVVAEV